MFTNRLYKSNLYKSFQFKLLNNEISYKNKLCNSLNNQLKLYENGNKQFFSILNLLYVNQIITKNSDTYIEKCRKIHEKKT